MNAPLDLKMILPPTTTSLQKHHYFNRLPTPLIDLDLSVKLRLQKHLQDHFTFYLIPIMSDTELIHTRVTVIIRNAAKVIYACLVHLLLSLT